ncbi:MAG: SRPBCC family protein [Myxococcales bacterium]|nr:SRPBCC family protein [Myxococcales bacterium]MCB9521937.1 SRPBCC family protein [Myxococcales bacterium]
MGTPFEIERSIDLKSAPADVFAVVSDLSRFESWSPWAKADPGAKIEVTTPPNAVGTVYRWHGKRSGQGSMTITDLTAPKHIELDLVFTAPFKARNTVVWAFHPESNGGTRFVWTMRGERGLGMRIMSALMRMDRMLERQFDEGLGYLQAIVDG